MKNIKHILHTLREEGRKITLTEAEKRHMHAKLLTFVNAHPSMEAPAAIPSPYFSYTSILMKVSSFAVVAFVIVGSTLYAAESALPGDRLYSVKVNVTEEVKGFFVTGDSNNVAWSEERVSQRLSEAEILAEQGKFDGNAQAQLEIYFDSNIKEFNAKLENIKKTDLDAAAIAAARFDTVLKVHQELLNNLDKSESKQAVMMATNPIAVKVAGIAGLVQIIDNQLASSSNSKMAIETKLVAQGSVNADAKSSDRRLKLALRSLENASTSVALNSASFEVTDKMILANQFLAEGRIQLEAKNYKDASVSFTKSKLQSDEALILIQVGKRLIKTLKGSTSTATSTGAVATTSSPVSNAISPVNPTVPPVVRVQELVIPASQPELNTVINVNI